MFTNYETRTFSYPSSTDAPLDVTCVGWTQGGCDVVWSDVLPRMLAVHGSAECGGKAVVELGAGSGLVGLLAARWASKVDITDGDEEEVSLIARNVEEHAPAGGCALSARFLEWGAEPAAEFLRDAQQPDGYDVVLAAQVVYVPAAIGPLAQSIAALMKADGTALLYNDAVSTGAMIGVSQLGLPEDRAREEEPQLVHAAGRAERADEPKPHLGFGLGLG